MAGTQSPLLVQADLANREFIHVSPASASWQYLNFAAREMKAGDLFSFDTGENELALVVLGGVCAVESTRGSWPRVGRRADVFGGMPYTLYLPRRTSFKAEALSPRLSIAYGWCDSDQDHSPQLVTPDQVTIEIRGGGNATRQINKMVPPGFDCQHLVVVEVFTPSGNWSSYPPHKHDAHRTGEDGSLLEADLEEIYFYQIDKPEGYALQRVYTSDGHLDELIQVRHNQLVMVPEGYHPVVSAHGYTTYYLNFLAGSAQSLANMDDPQYAWIKDTWTGQDPRLPLVSQEMEEQEER
jgi:5-deoxy-glucuronate isomerase